MNSEQRAAAAFARAVLDQLPPAATKAAAAGQKVRVTVRLLTPSEAAEREREKALAADQSAQGAILRTLTGGGYRPAAPGPDEPPVLAGWERGR